MKKLEELAKTEQLKREFVEQEIEYNKAFRRLALFLFAIGIIFMIVLLYLHFN